MRFRPFLSRSLSDFKLCGSTAELNLGKELSIQLEKLKKEAVVRPIRLAFFGPPGVGKGTYSTRIAQILGIQHLSSGEILREWTHTDPAEVGLRNVVDSGGLVPDDVVSDCVMNRIREINMGKGAGYVLDGYPRTLTQAMSLDLEENLDAVFHFRLREEALIIKLLGRRKCSHCGREYNVGDVDLPANEQSPRVRLVQLQPPRECVEHLTVREDDTPAVIKRRLQIYKETNATILEYYRKKKILQDFEIVSGIAETMPTLLSACLHAINSTRQAQDLEAREA